MKSKLKFKIFRFYVTLLFLGTAVLAASTSARAEMIEDPALAPALTFSSNFEPQPFYGKSIWQIPSAQAGKFLVSLKAFLNPPKPAPAPQPRPKKSFDPFKAARVLMTSA